MGLAAISIFQVFKEMARPIIIASVLTAIKEINANTVSIHTYIHTSMIL